ncbi:phosphoribosylamine--glycine ligase [Ligilactobacillus equi]|uniref:phosphoribosylamine--glycine ligase n=1 Tax=Ligilactobacillus equi TaxID=137357 RepID=UPI002ED42FC1
MQEKVLVIGSGGREAAIAQKLIASEQVAQVFVAPGNPGMQAMEGVIPVNIGELEFDALKGFVEENQIDWTFVGPEDALVAGIVDDFQAAGYPIFGPDKAAAMLEGSKDYAMRFMKRYQVPTAKFGTYTNSQAALAAMEHFGFPLVIKADGLAGGKGVVISPDVASAQAEIKLMFKKGQSQIVLEEYLEGSEYSMFIVVGQDDYQILPLAQDHKCAYDGDQGPNTGGMGSYSPVPQLSEIDYQKMLTEVVSPTIVGLRDVHPNYRGILYIGMILTPTGPKVIEYNVRLGDPETQVVLPRIKSDFGRLIKAAIDGEKLPPITVSPRACLGVVVAAQGYPKAPVKGQILPKMPNQEGIEVVYANVASQEEDLVGNGGRILMVCGQNTNLIQVQAQVYDYLAQINFDQCFYRKDIGFKVTQTKF